MNIVKGIRRRFKTTYRKHLHVPFNVLLGREPVIIYTAGKVGSTSVYESLPPSVFWVQVHSINPEEWEKVRQSRLKKDINQELLHSAQVRQLIVNPKRKAKYITAVRDPISRNISAYFQNFLHLTGRQPSSRSEDHGEQARMFMELFPHDRILTFFDTEYNEMLGLDVYATPFPFEQGYQRIRFAGGELLILRTESDDQLKEQAISEYLNLADFKLKRSNVRENQASGAAYQIFKEMLTLPDEYIDRMLNSRYTRHFYTETEIQAFRAKWSSRKP